MSEEKESKHKRNDQNTDSNDKLSQSIKWFLFVIFGASIVLFIIVPALIKLFGPLINPNIDLTSVNETFTVVSVFLGVFSALVGAYSIYQTSLNNKQTENIINKLDDVQKQQEHLNVVISMQQREASKGTAPSNNSWVADKEQNPD